MQTIEVKRKVFNVIEQLGERSYKVERHGNFYFLKEFNDDKKGFETLTDQAHYLKVSGVNNPKVLTYDKNTRIFVADFIEGETIFNKLLKEDLSEDIIKEMFNTFWYAKADKLQLDFSPINFKLFNGKLYYLPFNFTKFEDKEKFIQKDIRLWFFTKDFINYAESLHFEVDRSRLKNEYELNKNIALLTVKYYR